ncbi:MAG: nucleoside phosphorylase [Chitinophagales bacterium]|nr:nucleoside phosphorylase [Chitinophagales bacterium]
MIPAAELIINPDGSIYHLQLLPEEIADVIFTVGDPERVPQVSKYFDEIELARTHREIVTHTGYIGKKRVSVISTGMGTDNIDIVMNELDALANIDFASREVKPQQKSYTIVRIGTSGSIQKDIPLDSLLISEKAVGFDPLMHYYAHTPSDTLFEQQVLEFIADNRFNIPCYTAQAASELVEVFSDFERGITISAPGFYAPQGRKLRAQPAKENLVEKLAAFRYGSLRFTNLEMETAGIYALGNVLGHRCLSVNAILANRLDGTFSSNPQKIINTMIEKVLERAALL